MTKNKPAIESMSLDAAIAHADERASALSGPCAEQHAQLASWLRELQERRKATLDNSPVNPTFEHWWSHVRRGFTLVNANVQRELQLEAWNACRAAILQAGNFRVIPDGYVLVPKELTCEMDDAAWDAYHETRCMSDIWAALLAAAPQQESDNG